MYHLTTSSADHEMGLAYQRREGKSYQVQGIEYFDEDEWFLRLDEWDTPI
jgi:hypothetical protein